MSSNKSVNIVAKAMAWNPCFGCVLFLDPSTLPKLTIIFLLFEVACASVFAGLQWSGKMEDVLCLFGGRGYRSHNKV